MRSIFHARCVAVHQRLADAPRECRGGEECIALQRFHDPSGDGAAVVRRFVDLLIAFLLRGGCAGRDASVEPGRAHREIAQFAQLGCRQNLWKMKHRLSVDEVAT